MALGLEYLFALPMLLGTSRVVMVSLAVGGLVLPSRPGHGFMRLRKTVRSAPRKSFPSAMNETMPRPTGVCFLAHLLGSSSPRKLGKEDALSFF